MEDLIRRCLAWLRAVLVPPGNGRHRRPRPGTRTLITLRAVPPEIARRCRLTSDALPSPVDQPHEYRRALLRALEGVYVGPHHLDGSRTGAAR